MTLRWEKQETEAWYAYSGDLMVGMVVRMSAGPNPGRWTYDLSAVHTKWITKGRGTVKTGAQGKRAIQRAWSAFLDRAGLSQA